jgi:hypothetical protein
VRSIASDVAFHFTMKGDLPTNAAASLGAAVQLRIQEAMGSLIAGGPAATPGEP